MKLKKIVTCLLAAAIAAGGVMSGMGNYTYLRTGIVSAEVSAPSQSAVLKESAYITWKPISGADGYNVYCKPEGGSYVQLDSMLIRQYSGYFRADAVGLKEGKYVMKVVPTAGGNENSSDSIESEPITVGSYDRTGFAWTNGTSSGAYNEDGTLKDNAVVLYITEETKDTVTMDVATSSSGATANGIGIQNILNLYKKGYETRPLDIRVIGTVTDPAVTDKGDITIDGGGKLKCGITVEGIGDDAVISGFGLRVKNISNLEIRNIGVMLVDSIEGDNITLQQGNDHVWVHNCDLFYGMAGSDADQAKGDGALDCKKSTYITFSYNHFWDSGKCNLLGLSEGTTDDLYITYHHNWYDHSDSRHPRVRYYSAHVYNNYYDGNSKYGIGSTMGSSVFADSNYFRNCKYPMLTSMQGSDVADGAEGTFSGEDGGTIKAYGNYIEGQKRFVSYQEDKVEFDAYTASSRDEKLPVSVTSKQGSNTYNNFDTASAMYSYTADVAEDVPSVVKAEAGRLDGGDFDFTFTADDDSSYAVNTELMTKLKSYKPSVIAIGSGFKDGGEVDPTEPSDEPTEAPVTTVSSVTSKPVTTVTTKITQPDISGDAVYCSPDASSSGEGTKDDPTDVLSAIKMVKPGGIIYLLGGVYSFESTILIDDTNNGSAGNYKMIMAYPGDEVVWDFSAMEVSGSNRGVVLDGDYWYFKGFEITKAGDNGMLLSGNDNIIELMEFNDNQDTGLQLSRYKTSNSDIASWPSDNLILNCTAKNNCDNATMENADGFAAKLTCGEGNVFDGCMSYNNSDDGWDLYAKAETGPIGVVTIRNCIAFRNGYTEFGEGFGDCDGNGFKLGGGGIGSAHIVENCLAFENLNCGFTDNNNPKLGSISKCTAYNNGIGGNGKPNFSCYRCTDDGCDFSAVLTYVNVDNFNAALAPGVSSAKIANDKFVGAMENSAFYNSGKYYNVTDKQAIDNGDKIGNVVTITDNDFISLEVSKYVSAPEGSDADWFDFHREWRNEDGILNTGGFLETKDSSVYKDIGIDFQSIELPIDPIEPPVTTSVTTESFPVTTVSVTTEIITTEASSDTTPDIPVGSKYGDVNIDGEITIADVVSLNMYLLDKENNTLTEEGLANADCARDMIINSDDSLLLMNYIAMIVKYDKLGQTA